MKLVHFHFGKDGGSERFLVHLVRALGRRGVEQKVIIRPNRAWRGAIEPYADIIESHFRNASLDRILLPWRVRRLKTFRPDAFVSWMPRAARLLPRSAHGIRVARLGDYPRRIDCFKNADVLVCNTPGIIERLTSLGWTGRVEVISNFTPTDRVAAVDRRTLDTPADARVVTAIGRFVGIKRFDVLIRAIARMRSTYLWLVGDGEERNDLTALARELDVESRVRFVGWQPDARPYAAASDAVALSSDHETLGNVILEAWAQRVPVVSTRSKGPSWLIRDGENGLLVDLGDAEGFVQAFERIFAQLALAQTLVAGGAATLLGRHSEDSVVSAYLALFTSRPASATRRTRAA